MQKVTAARDAEQKGKFDRLAAEIEQAIQGNSSMFVEHDAEAVTVKTRGVEVAGPGYFACTYTWVRAGFDFARTCWVVSVGSGGDSNASDIEIPTSERVLGEFAAPEEAFACLRGRLGV